MKKTSLTVAVTAVACGMLVLFWTRACQPPVSSDAGSKRGGMTREDTMHARTAVVHEQESAAEHETPRKYLTDVFVELGLAAERSNTLAQLMSKLPPAPPFTPVEVLTRDALVHCVTQHEKVAWLRQGAIDMADQLLFTQGVAQASLTGAFETILRQRMCIEEWDQEAISISLLKSLRYRSLIPYLTAVISGVSATNEVRLAGVCSAYLMALEHPDALCAYLMLNTLIPSNSVLRQGILPVWSDGLPLYHRADCLPVYVEIARNPDKYNWGEWVTACDALCWYTNDVAIAELKRSFQTMRYWQRYWPYHNPGADLYRGAVYMRLQRELIEGKRAMPPMPPPLLDE